MKGATQLYQLTVTDTTEFQSTLPRRERPGASDTRPLRQHFNPRSREGSDASKTFAFDNIIDISIHAPAKGATSDLEFGEMFSADFNPRYREGSDASMDEHTACATISIHAPAKGATFDQIPHFIVYRISIHAPAKGATRCIV